MTSREHYHPLTLTVEGAAEALGIGRTLAYEAVRRGDIPTVRIGRRLLVPRSALDRFLGSAAVDDPAPANAGSADTRARPVNSVVS